MHTAVPLPAAVLVQHVLLQVRVLYCGDAAPAVLHLPAWLDAIRNRALHTALKQAAEVFGKPRGADAWAAAHLDVERCRAADEEREAEEGAQIGRQHAEAAHNAEEWWLRAIGGCGHRHGVLCPHAP